MWIAQPQQPGGEAALLAERAHPRDVGDAPQPADDRDVTVVAVAERLHRLPAEAREDGLGRVRAALDAALGDARRGAVLLPRLDGRIADDEHLRVPGDREVRPNAHPAAAVRLGARRRRDLPPERRRQDARGPEHGVGVDLLGLAGRRLHADQAVLHVHDLGLRAHHHAQLLELAARRGGAPGRVGREQAVHRLDQHDPGVLGVDRPEVVAQRVVGDLAQRAGELHARRPAPDEHERHPRPPLDRVGLAFGGFEGDQDPAPDLRRVVDGLQARRVRRPVLVTEVGVMGAGGDDQRVVGHRAAVREPDLALLGVDVDRLPEQHGRVALLAEDRAQGLRDLARRQGARGDLVEHRLEQVMVPPIDQGDVDEVAGLAEVLGGIQAGETAADDDHAVRRRGGRAPWQGSCVHASNLRPTAVHAQWTDVGSRAA